MKSGTRLVLSIQVTIIPVVAGLRGHICLLLKTISGIQLCHIIDSQLLTTIHIARRRLSTMWQPFNIFMDQTLLLGRLMTPTCFRTQEAYSVVPGSSPDDGSAAFEVCAPS